MVDELKVIGEGRKKNKTDLNWALQKFKDILKTERKLHLQNLGLSILLSKLSKDELVEYSELTTIWEEQAEEYLQNLNNKKELSKTETRRAVGF